MVRQPILELTHKCGTVAYAMDKNEEHKQWFSTKPLLGFGQRKSEFLLSEIFDDIRKSALKSYLEFHNHGISS